MTGPTILIADDDGGVRATLRRVLEPVGYHVVEASDGRQCLQALQTAVVDLLVTDVFMPELDGMEVIARVRMKFPVLPILAISGGGIVERDDTLEIAQRLGATRALAKPFDVAAFLATVRELLGER